MKLGLVTDCLADRSLEEAAAVCRRLGLEQVELAATGPRRPMWIWRS